jgi:hypothetical protein
MKPNKKWSHAELKVYVKAHGLDKAPVPLSGSKGNMVANLKKVNHWDHGGTGRPKPVPKKKKKEKKKFDKEEEVRPTERLEGPAAGSVKARAKTYPLPFPGMAGSVGARVAQRRKDQLILNTHFSQQNVRSRVENEAQAVGASAKAKRGIGQEEAAAQSKKRRKKKMMEKRLKAKGLL